MEHDPLTQFSETLRAAGLILKGPSIFDDRIHRCDVDGKNGRSDGAYRVKMEGDRSFGWYRNYQTHNKPQPWHANGAERLTREQRRHLAEVRSAQDAERDRKLLKQQELAAVECGALWDAALPVETHPYLTAKGVTVSGLRQGVAGQTVTTHRDDGSEAVINLEGKLFVPMRDIGLCS
jgi:phage/plasmid primase-like uncharacterized protein